MKKSRLRYIRWTLETILIAFILVCRFIPSWGEWYALNIYPSVSAILSGMVCWIPFSLEEWVVVGGVVALIVVPWLGRRRGVEWYILIRREMELLIVVYCWFYIGWGINYFRYDFFTRSGVERADYKENDFLHFVQIYTDSLNHTYTSHPLPAHEKLERELKSLFASVPFHFGLSYPYSYQHPKRVLFNGLYSKVGVLGYMGPFFSESQLNEDLLPEEYSFTFAHEFSHLLGVSSEAEANFWAYQICIRSCYQSVRYSGYFGLLPYVLSNAKVLLSEEKYREIVASIRPEVITGLCKSDAHWRTLYSPFVGRIQSVVYNWYLKGNRISSGQKNYAEVIGMIISVPKIAFEY